MRHARLPRLRLAPRPATAAAAVAALVCTVAGCGAKSTGTAASNDAPVVVSAAASLREAFQSYADAAGGPRPRFSFAGSDALAAQIRKGARPGVYAAADSELPQQLYDEGLVERPVVFARNRLVLAVPRDSKVRGLDELATGDLTVAIGSPSVPVGAYSREALGRLPQSQSKAILAAVRSEEPDVKGIVGKLTQGAVDAGFVYATDVKAAEGRLRAIDLPAAAQPTVSYSVAVVRSAPDPAAAQAFIDGLRGAAGQRALTAAGFESAPTP